MEKTISPPLEDELEEMAREQDEFLFEVAKEPESEQEAQISAVGRRCYCYCHCVR